jgi:hypothetical protein
MSNMPQLMLPIFPKRLTYINELIGFENKDGRVYYYHGLLPVFSHDEGDLQSFRFIASQLVVCGNVSQIDISKAFGIPYVTIKRSVKLLKDEGPEGFFKKKKGRTAHVLTPDKMKKAQTLLDKGHNASQVGKKIDAKAPAIRKAIQAGKLLRKKLQENNEEKPVDPALKTKSERSIIDSQSNMGVACTRENERILASLGKLTEAIPIFKPNVDVKSAGVLLSLPALLANGLLQHTDEVFSLPNGYYGMQSLFIMLAIAVLLRNQSIEAIRYCDAGEMGKIVGLDRIPELKTLRAKIKILTKNDQPAKWSRKLAQHWLEDNPKLAGTLYIDGHERVYNGKTKLPKRYISRQKLCLRGVSDYWVNDALGQPFFVVSKVVNPGMLAVLREDIVPQLLEDVPNQPDEEEFKTNRYLSRFGIVFDREGYSPPFFKEMWKKHISCYTYRKYAKDDWPETEFINTEVVFPNGEKAEMELAERGIFYKAEKIWIREIRKLTETGHQTSIVTTDYSNNAEMIGGTMFSRWSQENFFKYMMKHFGIDRLIEYGVEKIDETIKVVNPTYRNLDYQIRSLNGKLSRQKAEYGDIIFKKEIEEKEVKDYIQKKSELIECMENMKQKIEKLKAKRKKAGKHIAISELPEDQQFDQLKKGGKQFIDTIKMIAYRAETSVVNIVREYSHKKDEARSIVRQMFETDADVLPDEENGILNVRIHNMSNPRDNRCVEQVCKVLNESETIFPGTNLRLFFDLVSNQIHAVPEF